MVSMDPSFGLNPTVATPIRSNTYVISLNDNGRVFVTSGQNRSSAVQFTLPSPSSEGFRLRIGVNRAGRPAMIDAGRGGMIAFPRRSQLTTTDNYGVSHEGAATIISRDPGAFIDLVWGPPVSALPPSYPADENYWHVASGSGLWTCPLDALEYNLADIPATVKMDFGKPAGTSSEWISIPVFIPDMPG